MAAPEPLGESLVLATCRFRATVLEQGKVVEHFAVNIFREGAALGAAALGAAVLGAALVQELLAQLWRRLEQGEQRVAVAELQAVFLDS